MIESNGSVTDVPYVGVPYPNLSRIVEDPGGRYWIYSIGPSMTNRRRCELFIAPVVPGDATPLGSATVIPLADRFSCSSETRNYDVSLRSGTERATQTARASECSCMSGATARTASRIVSSARETRTLPAPLSSIEATIRAT